MNLDRLNFAQQFSVIMKDIAAADFIAFDCQFSGLTSQLGEMQGLFPSHAQFYERIKQTANNFSILQFGITTFLFDGYNYKPKVYNFYLEPKAKIIGKNQVMLGEVASLTFLAERGMDFTRVLTKGIRHKRINQQQQDKVFASTVPIFDFTCMFFDQNDQKILDGIQTNQIQVFLTGEEKGVNIDFYGKNILMYFRDKFGQLEITNRLKNMKEFQFNVRKNKLFYKIKAMKQEEEEQKKKEKKVEDEVKEAKKEETSKQSLKEEERNQDKKQQKEQKKESSKQPEKKHKAINQPEIQLCSGFEKIIKQIIDCQKPIVGHFPNLDLGLFFTHFIGDLPETYQQFCENINYIFPYIFDTKVISRRVQSKVKGHINVSLKPLFQACRFGKILKPFTNIDYSQLEEYIKKDNAHEAGYDSFMTGCAFVGMANFILQEKGRIAFEKLGQENKILYSRYTGQVSMLGPHFCAQTDYYNRAIVIGAMVSRADRNNIAKVLANYGTLSIYENHDELYYIYEREQHIEEILYMHPGLKLFPYEKRRIIKANRLFS